jgi:FtsZ-interacting cell division protein ZipA
MSTIPFFLADAYMDTVMASWRFLTPITREGLIILSATALVTLLVLTWAVFIRKRRRRRHELHHSHRHSSSSSEVTQTSEDEAATPPPEKRRHRRRSHHKHRRRNPTLAETGGLPPIRPQDPPDPQP